jgi:hypothetical protein
VQKLTIAFMIGVPLFAGVTLMSLSAHLGLFIAHAQPLNLTGLLANLTDDNHNWKPFKPTYVSQMNGNLVISIITENPKKIFNRAFLQTQVNSSIIVPPILTLDYASKDILHPPNRKPVSIVEIRGDNNSKILWSAFLNDTSGKLRNDLFLLPSSVLNKPIEFRLYIITEGGPSQFTLNLKNLKVFEDNRANIAWFLDSKRFLSYNLSIGNKTYPVGYDIYGAKNFSINAGQNMQKMLLNFNSTTDGIVLIKVPRVLIDAKSPSNIDIPYSILVDRQKAVAHEIQSSNLSRTLAVEFTQGNKQIEIIGTRIQPR